MSYVGYIREHMLQTMQDFEVQICNENVMGKQR
jgi:hypothetical protein